MVITEMCHLQSCYVMCLGDYRFQVLKNVQVIMVCRANKDLDKNVINITKAS